MGVNLAILRDLALFFPSPKTTEGVKMCSYIADRGRSHVRIRRVGLGESSMQRDERLVVPANLHVMSWRSANGQLKRVALFRVSFQTKAVIWQS